MFQIETFTEAHVASVTNRVEKHGDDDKPAVSLSLELTAANTLLDLIDPKIREALYKAVDGQEQLPGVEPATPVLRCNSFDRHTLPTAYEGWTLQVDDGIDDTQPMTFGSTKVDKFVVEAKQGGSIVLRFRAGTSDVDADKLGKLAMHNGQSIWITLKAPEKRPDAIDASSSAKDLPPDAGSLFAQEHGGYEDPEDADRPDKDDTDDEGGVDVTGSDGSWPFPKNGEGAAGSSTAPVEEDELLPQAERLVVSEQRASISMVQRNLQVGYTRAARLMEALEQRGVVSAMDGKGDRTVLMRAPAIETSRPGTRTARGRDKTKKALAEGAKANGVAR